MFPQPILLVAAPEGARYVSESQRAGIAIRRTAFESWLGTAQIFNKPDPAVFVAQECVAVLFHFADSRNVRDKTDYYLPRRGFKHAPKNLVFVPGGSTVIFRPSVASKCTAARGLSALAVPHDTLQRRPRLATSVHRWYHGRGWC